MSTMHRRREWRDKNEPGIKDLTLAYMAGFWTAALCAVIVVTLWR